MARKSLGRQPEIADFGRQRIAGVIAKQDQALLGGARKNFDGQKFFRVQLKAPYVDAWAMASRKASP